MVIVNGEKRVSVDACISVFDRGLTLGDGLFETMRVHESGVPLWSYHWKRLVLSCQWMEILLPFDEISLQQMIQDLMVENGLSTGGVRITVTRGSSERGLLPTGKEVTTTILTAFDIPPLSEDSMTATIVDIRRNEHSLASQIKSISYLDNILAKKEAVARGFDEAFLLNSQSNLAEGATSNVFMVKHQKMVTPPLQDGALPGVMRAFILHQARLKGLDIQEQTIDQAMLFDADEIFISNALRGIIPIRQLDGQHLKIPGEKTLALSRFVTAE